MDDLMIHNIMSGASSGNVNRLSMELVSALVSLSDETVDLDYKHGISIGRKLFRMMSYGKSYSWYGESVPDLMSFMEAAGYGTITYKMLPFSTSIKIHQSPHDVGAKLHTFESGLMSGFLTAAKGQLVHVNEEKCASNGSEHCDFVTSDSKANSEQHMSAESMYAALQNSPAAQQSISREYYALATSGISQEHIARLGDRAFGLGSAIGSMIAAERKGPDVAKSVIDVIRTAYPGAVSVKRVSPSNVRVSFDLLSSRKGVIELMRRFIDGVVSAAFGVERSDEGISAAKDNSYSMTVRIK